MQRLLSSVFVLMLLLGVVGIAPAIAAVKQGICIVCQVRSGEAEAEDIKATRTYAGKEYGFCSLKCAQTFDADPAAYVPPTFPRSAPAFSLKDLSGKPVSNASFKGQVVLLDFWATWCAPCVKSMPELQSLHAKYASRGFQVVGISIDEGVSGAVKVKKFIGAKRIAYPIAIDSGKRPAWEAFWVKTVPAAYLLDREGRIVAQWTGAPADMAQLEAKLEELLQVPQAD